MKDEGVESIEWVENGQRKGQRNDEGWDSFPGNKVLQGMNGRLVCVCRRQGDGNWEMLSPKVSYPVFKR